MNIRWIHTRKWPLFSVNCRMNIYDLAGNVAEWTLESRSFSYVVFRGDYTDYDGDHGITVNYRDIDDVSYYYDCIGLRAALY